MTDRPAVSRQITAAQAAARHWDVIGTGIGGGIAGRRLAEHGLSVLFVEKGPLGHRGEGQELRSDLDDYVARQSRGFWPTQVEARRLQFRRAFRRRLGKHRMLFLNVGPTLNYGHACGTLRFGTDPATSVLDPDCRAHDLDNLYVADASFMPSSMGVNPSLTIAANALRVADIVAARMASAERKAG